MLEHQDDSDTALFHLIQLSDRSAFNELYKRHVQALFRYANGILNDRDATNDVLQEVFIWFWNNRNQIRPSSIKSYLFVGVKFKIANYIRDGKLRDSVYTKVKDVGMGDLFYDHDELEVKELRAFIYGFIETLPDKCRYVFQLSRVEGLSHKEIAEKLNISEKTVENQISIALKKLRQKMTKNPLLSILC
ncbi:RNA polymerase sigma-70 factor, ECF subfamily [Pedobacter steynii]|uniref:RNA polymerase sigma-70 factor, ECF subfamily n=1 Tax=Pedobacter steynii TaxID=430522 RepID=A0A1G9Z4T0_9SPHI|nr:RNA polymerase sigma-70 factor [Pedobacter steynii]NQX39928.1 RNA polymerase sigma-70 factor [Pedobacter steynii]SDN15683.1 RNA polymerase sigma-70 factor, ECF subfamily [Pedobacter steynii]